MKSVLVTIANKEYIDAAKQLFSSVYFNSGWKGDYLLITDNSIPERDLEWFEKKGIYIKKFKPIYNKTIGPFNKSPFMLFKLNLFKTFFKKWEKIVYLDSDIIVRGPLNELLNVDKFGAVLRGLQQEKSNYLFGQFVLSFDSDKLNSICKKNTISIKELLIVEFLVLIVQ